MSTIRRLAETVDTSGEGSGRELAHRDFGTYDPPKPYWETSLWLNLMSMGFGANYERQYGAGATWPDQFWLTITVGPLHFVATRTWNQQPLRRTAPANTPAHDPAEVPAEVPGTAGGARARE